MSITLAAANSQPPLEQPDPAGTDSTYLLRLLEKQPSCLIRVALDGTLLAVNEAGLKLLGTEVLHQVLGRSLVDWLQSAQRPQWAAFADRVWAESSGSIECELVDQAGTHRVVLFQGMALREHPDGIRSMLVSARDASTTRRLEHTLEQEGQDRQQADGSPAQLDATVAGQRRLLEQLQQGEAERQRLQGLLSGQEGERERLVTVQATERARMQQTLAEEHQLALLVRDREHRQRIEAVQRQLADAQREHQQLSTAFDGATQERGRQSLEFEQLTDRLRERERELQQLAQRLDARDNDGVQVAQRLEQQELERRELARRLETSEADHAAAAREVEELKGLVTQREAEAKQLEIGHATALEDLQNVLTEEHRAPLRERERKVEELTGLVAQHEADVRQLEIGHATALEDLQNVLSEEHRAALRERERKVEELTGLVAQREAEAKQLEIGHATALEDLRNALIDERRAVLLQQEREAEARMSALEAALAQARSERERLELLVDGHESERQELANLLVRRDADLREIETRHTLSLEELEKALTEQYSTALLRAEVESDRRVSELAASLIGAQAEQERLEQLLDAQDMARRDLLNEHAAVLAQRERESQEVLGNLQLELAQAMVDRQRLGLLLTRAETEQQRLKTGLATSVANCEQLATTHAEAVRERDVAISKGQRAVKELADCRVDLETLDVYARSLEGTSAAGRLAVGVSGELRAMLEIMNARARALLHLSSLDAESRQELEALRGEALSAASLARQIVPAPMAEASKDL